MGISIIDEERKKLFGILNKAVLAKKHNDNPEETEEVLNEMTNYALTHFATEETYMKEFNYPEYKYHKEEHYKFTIKTIAYLGKMREGDYQIINEVLEFLKQWWVKHIRNTDTKYIDCFKKNGLA